MDLGIKGRRAVVCASSRGLGKACAEALSEAGCSVFINGLDGDRLEATATEISNATGNVVVPVRADINTDEGRRALLEACPDPDILVNNNAGPTPKHYSMITPQMWEQALNANMLAAVYLIQAVLPAMRERKFGRIVNITSAMVKSPHISDMGLSVAARTGLTAFCKATSREVIIDNVTINNLLPERFDTGRQVFMAQKVSKEDGITYEEARRKIVKTIAADRFGRPEEFGNTCAFVCSNHAGFMSGQSVQLDGGSFHGLL